LFDQLSLDGFYQQLKTLPHAQDKILLDNSNAKILGQCNHFGFIHLSSVYSIQLNQRCKLV